MDKTKGRNLALFASLAVALLLAVAITGRSSKSYSLTKDAALTSEWGDTVQFKVDENWTNRVQDDNSSLADNLCRGLWCADGDNEGNDAIYAALTNTQSSSYDYNNSATYAGWQEFMTNTYSKSAEEQADELNSYSSSEKMDSDSLISYSNCEVKDTGTVAVGNENVRTYSVSYHYQMSDSMYSKWKEKNPGLQQEGDRTDYYALIKDGDHDFEMHSRNSQLLKDVLSTMEFDW